MRANGFHYDAVKIFCDKNGRVTKVPYREYVIPDVTAGIFWLKNRDPQHWRDSQQRSTCSASTSSATSR